MSLVCYIILAGAVHMSRLDNDEKWAESHCQGWRQRRWGAVITPAVSYREPRGHLHLLSTCYLLYPTCSLSSFSQFHSLLIAVYEILCTDGCALISVPSFFICETEALRGKAGAT